MPVLMQNAGEKQRKKKVGTASTASINVGAPVCYDRDYGTAASSDMDRAWQVEQPSSANAKWFAGIVNQDLRGSAASGMLEIIEPVPGTVCDVWCSANATLGSTLIGFDASFVAKETRVGSGMPFARAIQTIDRSTAAGRVLCELLGPTCTSQISRLMGDRTLSDFWFDCPSADFPETGIFYFEDFTSFDTSGGQIVATQAGSSGTFAMSTASADGGIGCALPDCGSTATGAGINVQWDGGPVVNAASDRSIWWEARVQVAASAGNGGQFFIGLSGTDTAIVASSVMAGSDVFGYYTSATAPADTIIMTAGGEKATNNEQTSACLNPMASATWYKLGGKITGTSANAGTGRFYINGVYDSAAASDITSAAVATVRAMVPSIVCQNQGAGTDGPDMRVDWIAVAQTGGTTAQ
jgi:hypothetical protein